MLEFDHIGSKSGAVSQMRHFGANLERLAHEVAQCEVVCANCHRRRTASRGSWIRRDGNWRTRLSGCRPEIVRNLRFVYETLEEFPCIDCGEQDICVLEFDHIGPKQAPVMRLAMTGSSLKRLANEVAQCEIRCANCHRRRNCKGSRVSANAA